MSDVRIKTRVTEALHPLRAAEAWIRGRQFDPAFDERPKDDPRTDEERKHDFARYGNQIADALANAVAEIERELRAV